MHWRDLAAVACLSFLLAGCHVVQYPDPNAVDTDINPAIVQRNIKEAYRILGNRVNRGELSAKERDDMILHLVQTYAGSIDLSAIPPLKAWEYADILRQAGRWEDAYSLLQIAVKVAPDDDRFVNDSLQLARCAAHLGKVDEAIALCRGTFKVPPDEKAPILMSVLYEVVPEGLGKGKDLELAGLLQDAIEQHKATIVDQNTLAGQEFLASRPHHISNAWAKVVSIYASHDRQDLARDAIKRAEQSTGGTARV